VSETATRPEGKDEVVEALLDAATALFAEKGPAVVSAREVARRARVNHGLVHRHFGTKDNLVRAVLDRLVGGVRQSFADIDLESGQRRQLFAAIAADQRYWRVLVRALLDGHAGSLLKGDFPLMRRGVERVREAQRAGRLDADLDPRELVATYMALVLGWLVFEPFIAAATGLDRVGSARRRDRLLALWERLEHRATAP